MLDGIYVAPLSTSMPENSAPKNLYATMPHPIRPASIQQAACAFRIATQCTKNRMAPSRKLR